MKLDLDDVDYTTEEIDTVMVATLAFKTEDQDCSTLTVAHTFLDRSQGDTSITYVLVEREMRELYEAIGQELERFDWQRAQP
jgi:hypothetical protein